jgi:tetratricopeptide (TPR) repeat protein
MLESACVIVLVLLPQLRCAAATQQWRAISRSARIAVEHGNYQQALNEYKYAIDLLQNESPGSDAEHDLFLAIAETYRLKGDFHASLAVLDAIGKKLDRAKPDDPVLLSRYWRRRSLLQESMGDRVGGAKSYFKSLVIAGKYFDCDSSYYSQYWVDAMQKLTAAKDWELVLEALAQLHEQLQLKGIAVRDLPAAMRNEYALVCGWLRSKTFEFSQVGNLDIAGKIVSGVAGVENDYKEIISLWTFYSNCCFEKNQPTRLNLAIDNVGKFLDAKANSSSVEDIRAAIEGRTLLLKIYMYRKDTEEAWNQWQKLFALDSALGKAASGQEKLSLVSMLDEEAAKRINEHLLDPHTAWILDKEIELTALPKGFTRNSQDHKLAEYHCRSRVLRALLFELADKRQEADRALSNISPAAIALAGEPGAVLRNIAAPRISKENFDDLTLGILKMSVRITEWPPAVTTNPASKELAELHCWARNVIANVYSKRNEPNEAVKALFSVSPKAMDQSGQPELWRCRVNTRSSELYKEMGNIEEACRRYDLAKHYYIALPPSASQKRLHMRLDTLSRQLPVDK